jgi:two-component system, LytTR family, response regulator
MTLRALTVDDEPPARRALRRLLQAHPDLELIGECADGEAAVAAILTQQPDMVFLDVQMPEIDGFEVIRRIGLENMPITIFVTAYNRYALPAFDANAIDYLLKPISKERFERALMRARKRISEGRNRDQLHRIAAGLEQLQAQRGSAERLAIDLNGRIVLLSTRDIDWIGSDGNYARLHLGTRHYEIRETLTNLLQKLDPLDFIRIHRSTIVNVRKVREIQRWFHGHHLVVLDNGTELRMSRYQVGLARRLGLASGRPLALSGTVRGRHVTAARGSVSE